MDDFQDYAPTGRFNNVQMLFDNHFRFLIDGFTDVAFYAVQVSIPGVSSLSPLVANPLTTIPMPGDHLKFESLQLTFLVDAGFKSYFSLFYWMKGYGFPTSYDDIVNFTASRQAQLGNPRPNKMDALKTNATLYVMAPDTDSAVAEISFSDLFPTALGAVTMDLQHHEPQLLKCMASFSYTDFNITLTKP